VIVLPNRDRKAERREATRQEILAAAWDAARETSLAGLTLRDIAARVGMQQPSLYSHFASKNAIYDGMFEQAWRTFLDHVKDVADDLPTGPRARGWPPSPRTISISPSPTWPGISSWTSVSYLAFTPARRLTHRPWKSTG
jgi:AcrR family transcriptional regulator